MEPLLTENPNNGDPIPIIDEWCWASSSWPGLIPMAGSRLSSASRTGCPPSRCMGQRKVGRSREEELVSTSTGHWPPAWPGRFSRSTLSGSSNAGASKSSTALYRRHAPRADPKAEQGRPQRALPMRIGQEVQGSITVAPTECIEPRGEFQRHERFSGGTMSLSAAAGFQCYPWHTWC